MVAVRATRTAGCSSATARTTRPSNDALDEVAAAHGVSTAAVAVSWLTTHPAGMQVVVGSTRPERIAEAAPGAELRLSRPEWYRLFTAAGYALP